MLFPDGIFLRWLWKKNDYLIFLFRISYSNAFFYRICFSAASISSFVLANYRFEYMVPLVLFVLDSYNLSYHFITNF